MNPKSSESIGENLKQSFYMNFIRLNKFLSFRILCDYFFFEKISMK